MELEIDTHRMHPPLIHTHTPYMNSTPRTIASTAMLSKSSHVLLQLLPSIYTQKPMGESGRVDLLIYLLRYLTHFNILPLRYYSKVLT